MENSVYCVYILLSWHSQVVVSQGQKGHNVFFLCFLDIFFLQALDYIHSGINLLNIYGSALLVC